MHNLNERFFWFRFSKNLKVNIWVERADNYLLRKITRNHSIPRGIAALQAKGGVAPFMGSGASHGKGFKNRKIFKLYTDLY
jgi:hypothetical protein